MFFNPSKAKTKGLLQIDKEFATLDEITSAIDQNNSIEPNGKNLVFTFSYKISQLKALENNATSVRILIKKSNKAKPVILNSKKAGGNDNLEVINKILTQKTRLGLIDTSEEVIFDEISSVSSRINNQLLDVIRTKQTDLDSTGLKKQKIVLRTVQEIIENNLEKNIVGRNIFRSKVDVEKKITKNIDSSFLDEKQELYYKLLSAEIPPSSLDLANSRTISTINNVRGTLKSNRKDEYLNDYSNELTNFLLFEGIEEEKSLSDKNPQEIVTTLENVVDSYVLVKTKVSLNASVLNASSPLIVNFELLQTKYLDSGEKITVPVESINRNLNPNEHFSKYFYPTKAPVVSYSKDNHTVYFCIQQIDDKADTVKIYRKEINDSISSNYVYVGEVDVASNRGAVLFSLTHNYKDFSIYRFIPFSRNAKEFFPCQFTDVVVKEKKNSKHLTIVPRLVEEGVLVCAYNKDPMIYSARLLIKNLSKKQKKYADTGKTFHFFSKDSQSSVVIPDLQKNDVYEFATMVMLKSGVEVFSNHKARIEFLPYESKSISIILTNTSNPGTNDVQMTISATLQDDPSKQTKELLDSFSKNYGSNDSRVAAFNKLVYFNVIRYDTLTGEEADLGIIKNGESFTDSIQSAKFNAPQIIQGRNYKYLINPLIREPDSFGENVETKDEITKKSYKFSPKQFLHPLALQKGIIRKLSSIDKDPKHEALYGKIGFSYYFEYDTEISKPIVNNFIAKKENKKIFLSWNIIGVLSEIDHFILMKESNKIRTIIGKSHSIISNMIYFNDISYDDLGENKYIIVPVYSDFSTGMYVYSNELLIEESDVKA